MTDVGTPSDLVPLKEPLVEAVIEAYMAHKATEGSDFEFYEGGCSAGEFRYRVPRFGRDTRAYVSYPGGQWKIDQWLDPDDEVDPGTSVGDIVTFDAASAYEMVRREVSEWIEPWIACGDPQDLADRIRSMAVVVDELYVQDEVRMGEGSDDAGGTSVPVADVQAAIADMRSELSSLNGLAIDALERAYVNDVGLTISGQRALAGVAALAVAGEAEAWSNAFANLREFFTGATADFASFARSSGGSTGDAARTTLTVLSGTATAAAGATFAFPPAAGALGVVAGLAAIGATFWPSEAAVPATILTLEGSDFDSLCASFGNSVRQVNSEIVEAEHSLAVMCRNVLTTYAENPDSFSITARGRADVPQPGDNLPRFLGTDAGSAPIELYAGDQVRIVHSKLRRVSAMIEHVGQHQRSVAGRVGEPDAGAWGREYLQGGILGWGPTGHFHDFAAVVGALVDLLLLEARTANRIAEHCVDISTGFSRTEDEISATLQRLETRLGS